MTIPPDVADFLTRKRRRKAARRVFRASRMMLISRRRQLEHSYRFGDKSKIISMLAQAYYPSVLHGMRSHIVKVPRVFSIIEDPVQAISVIQSFAKALQSNDLRDIEIDQSMVAVYDLAANALLDIVAAEACVEARHRSKKLRFSGKYPKDIAIKRFIRSMGMVKHLNIKHEMANDKEISKIRLFDRRNRNYHEKRDPHKADQKSRVVAGFADHFNSCLKDHQRALTFESRAKLCEYISETLCNAEDHPGFVDWTVQGYLDNSLETPICEIAIFNFGKSIAETLSELPVGDYTRLQIDPYIILHNGRQFFKKTWRVADLMTLIALQGHVSCKNTDEEDTRGQGMGDLIDFFQSVHRECAEHSKVQAKMAIVSGGTYILFDGTYKMRSKENRGRVIAFNDQNDLLSKPDERFVKSLGDVHFPGTIISIRFPLSNASTVSLGDK